MFDFGNSGRRAAHGLLEFTSALDIAISGCGFLHVGLNPPGHTDFGSLTIFCHCPRCKADSGLERWESEYPSEPMQCAVCGFEYSPAATSDRRRTYRFSEVQCMSCFSIIKRADFDPETQDFIADYLAIREREARLRVVNRVIESDRRHPGAIIDSLFEEHEEEMLRKLGDQGCECSLEELRAIMVVMIANARTNSIPLVPCPRCSRALF